MILYHPRNDIFNCMYRFIHIMNLRNDAETEFIRLRIYDFFYLFPHCIEEISFPRLKGVSKLVRSAKSIPKPYDALPDRKRVFSEMGDFHIQALNVLVAKGILKERAGMVSKGENFESEQVRSLASRSFPFMDVIVILFEIMDELEVLGEGGIKRRTSLMEHRYDSV